MRKITMKMIQDFKIDKLGYDFMGYTYRLKRDLSFHHLVVPHKDCKKYGLGEGYLYWNGAILAMRTAHEYLHIIQHFDPDVFDFITSEMMQENLQRQLAIISLKRIRSALLSFEKEHCSDINAKGNHIIKPEYVEQRIKL